MKRLIIHSLHGYQKKREELTNFSSAMPPGVNMISSIIRTYLQHIRRQRSSLLKLNEKLQVWMRFNYSSDIIFFSFFIFSRLFSSTQNPPHKIHTFLSRKTFSQFFTHGSKIFFLLCTLLGAHCNGHYNVAETIAVCRTKIPNFVAFWYYGKTRVFVRPEE